MLPIALLSCFLAIVSFASTSDLAFDTPNFNAAPTNTNGLPYFTQDNLVTISWYTSFANTTLTVFQELGNGTVLYKLLAVNWPSSKTERVWTIDWIGNHSIEDSQFYFFLQNSNNSFCSGCNLTSPHFIIKAQTSVPTTTTIHTPSTPHSTAHTTSTESPPPSQSGNVVSDTVRPKTAGDLTVELGVGLGAGIPAVLALVGIFFLWLRHRRNEKHNDGEEPKEPPEEDQPLQKEKAPMRERDSHLSRESGALGPYAANPSPTWEQQEARQQEEMQRQHQSRHRRGSSTRQIPFRPSLGAHSEVSDESSRHSWIDEFEFERPGYRDTDEMSQAEEGIRAAPRRSWHQQSAHSQSSFVDVYNFPPMPQPVHQYYPDRRWPGR